MHLSQERLDCNTFLSDVTRSLLASCDGVGVDALRLKMAVLPGHETSDVAILLKDIESGAADAKKAARTVSGDDEDFTMCCWLTAWFTCADQAQNPSSSVG